MAVVVTYRRPELLRLNLDQLVKCRVDEIFIVNNGGLKDQSTTDVMANYCSKYRHVKVHHSEINRGGAGGFSIGLERFIESDFDFAWLMDDDTLPNEEALEFLLQADNFFDAQKNHLPRPGFYCSKVLWKDSKAHVMNVPHRLAKHVFSVPTGTFPVRSCSFVSVLIPKFAVKQVGFPVKEFFIWADDSEYTTRITRSFGYGLECPESVVTHLTPENVGVNFACLSYDNYVKYRYGLRNTLAFHLAYGRPLLALKKFCVYGAQVIFSRNGYRLKAKVFLGILETPRLIVIIRSYLKRVS